MDIKITTFLFSKYSNNCKAFIEMLSKIPNEYKVNLKMTDVCIDNEKIRKNILNSKKIDIKMVPCILIVYNNGAIEKFEGSDAFNWLNEIIGNIIKSQETENQIKQQQEIQNQLQQQISSQQQQLLEQQQLFEQQKLLEQEKENQKVVSIPAKKQLNKKGKTSIDDLETESEDNIDEFEEDIQETSKSKNALTVKKESLMNTAMAMQKSRDNLDKNLKTPPII